MRLKPLMAVLLCGLFGSAVVPVVAHAQATGTRQTPTRKKPARTAATEPPPKPPVPPEPAPPPPPPWTSPGAPATSTSGAALVPEAAATQGPKVAPALASSLSAQEAAALEDRVRALEARLAADESTRSSGTLADWVSKFHVSGFIQPQFLVQSYNTAASPDLTSGSLPANVTANDTIAKSDGTTTNGDFFRVRRARLKTEFMPTEGTRLVFEFDPTSPSGRIGTSGTIMRQVEAQGIARWSDFVTTEFAAGIFKIPFGREVLEYDADRPFIEHSWGEQNMTPGEFDTGARAYTTWTKDGRTFAVQLAIVNGQTEGEPGFSLDPDLNRAKDYVGRTFFDFGDWVELGASGYVGEGQTIDTTELRFKQFLRWAANGELTLHHTFSPKLGATKLLGEVTFAQNMDRGVYYAFAVPTIPSIITSNVVNMKERSVWVRLEQDFSKWATLGLRWDQYTPDTSSSDDARNTFAAVGVVHFTPWLQAMLEYDHAIDHVHAAGLPAPNKQIEMGSGVLQARF